MKKRFEYLDLLRVAAILLVINSHLDPLYPLPALATGGAAGNGLFFIISGFCLRLQPGFFRHMGRRMARLYPGVWISFFVQLLCGMKTLDGFSGFVRQCIWPTAFWFVGAILLFDGLLWLLQKVRFVDRFRLFSLCMAALYGLGYMLLVDKSRWSVEEAGLSNGAQAFKLIYCFYIYCLGFYLKEKGVPEWAKRKKGMLPAMALGMFVLSFGVKAVMVKWPATMAFQGITQLLVTGFAFTALLVALTGEDAYRARVKSGIRKAVSACSALSLEMYLVQFPVISLCKGLPFPVNVLVMLAVTGTLAFLLNRADRMIFRWADGQMAKTEEGAQRQ